MPLIADASFKVPDNSFWKDLLAGPAARKGLVKMDLSFRLGGSLKTDPSLGARTPLPPPTDAFSLSKHLLLQEQ